VTTNPFLPLALRDHYPSVSTNPFLPLALRALPSIQTFTHQLFRFGGNKAVRHSSICNFSPQKALYSLLTDYVSHRLIFCKNAVFYAHLVGLLPSLCAAQTVSRFLGRNVYMVYANFSFACNFLLLQVYFRIGFDNTFELWPRNIRVSCLLRFVRRLSVVLSIADCLHAFLHTVYW